MIEFLDRIPGAGKQNKKKIIHEDGREEIVTIIAADDAIETGTPINRKALMAIQGFDAITTTFDSDGTIIETNGDGEATTITFNADGTIVEQFVGTKTITKTIIFNDDGTISQTIA